TMRARIMFGSQELKVKRRKPSLLPRKKSLPSRCCGSEAGRNSGFLASARSARGETPLSLPVALPRLPGHRGHRGLADGQHVFERLVRSEEHTSELQSR